MQTRKIPEVRGRSDSVSYSGPGTGFLSWTTKRRHVPARRDGALPGRSRLGGAAGAGPRSRRGTVAGGGAAGAAQPVRDRRGDRRARRAIPSAVLLRGEARAGALPRDAADAGAAADRDLVLGGPGGDRARHPPPPAGAACRRPAADGALAGAGGGGENRHRPPPPAPRARAGGPPPPPPGG